MASSAFMKTASTPRVSPIAERRLRRGVSMTLVTLLGLGFMALFLLPLGYMITTAFKSDTQASAQNAPLWPAKAMTFRYKEQDLPLYNVPTDEGLKQYALVKGYREDSDFVDPAHPEQGVFNWKGRYRTLNPVYQFSPLLDNFPKAWDQVQFDLLFRNTFLLALISTIGTLMSCISVAYGFSRFRIP